MQTGSICTSMQWSTDRCIPCSQLPFLFTVASYNVIFIATYKYVTNQLATCLLLFSCTLAHHLLNWKEVCSKMLIEFCMFQLNIMNAVRNKQIMLTFYEIYTKWPSYITNQQSSQITIPSLQSCVHAWSAHARVYICTRVSENSSFSAVAICKQRIQSRMARPLSCTWHLSLYICLQYKHLAIPLAMVIYATQLSICAECP